MKPLFIFGLAVAMLSACGNDPVTTAGYFDDDVDKSNTTTDNSTSAGVQNFNNTGSGNMEVNIYNNQPSIPEVNTIPDVNTSVSIQPSNIIPNSSGIGISSIKLELIGKFLYGTNLTDYDFSVSGAYRTSTPSNLDMSFDPYQTASEYVGSNSGCITITSLIFKQYNSRRMNYDIINTWTGTYTICDTSM